MPMFPLGSVLLPGAVLPLHVFEPRYRALVDDCLAADEHEFGVVLIDRGHEVGGGDVRRATGTVARMVQVAELDGGRFAVVAVGTRRIRVDAWLRRRPVPARRRRRLARRPTNRRRRRRRGPRRPVPARRVQVRRIAALAIELGDVAGDPSTDLSDDPLVGSYQLAVLAPLASADEYDLLCAAGPRARLHLLDERLDDVDAMQRFRLASD